MVHITGTQLHTQTMTITAQATVTKTQVTWGLEAIINGQPGAPIMPTNSVLGPSAASATWTNVSNNTTYRVTISDDDNSDNEPVPYPS
jgi:hypothetical protein